MQDGDQPGAVDLMDLNSLQPPDATAARERGIAPLLFLSAVPLALFLPRATMPESPFRFVVVDDPVQAMDPARVDGLACVLRRVAGDRQVVVFTHDERLPEAVRRLGIEATILRVERESESRVAVVPHLDDVERSLEEARALVRTVGMPVDVIENTILAFDTDPTVPGFYQPGSEPTGRFFAPATCDALPIVSGNCAPDLYFTGRWFASFDVRIVKKFAIGRRATFEFAGELLNAFNATNFNHALNPTSGDPFRITSGASGARQGQLVWRVSW